MEKSIAPIKGLFVDTLNQIFLYHKDCYKDNLLISPEKVKGLDINEIFIRGESLLPKLKGSEPEKLMNLEISFSHPISQESFMKLIKNELIVEESSKVKYLISGEDNII